MRNSFLALMSLTIFSLSVFLSGCVPTSTGSGGSASLMANKTADQSLYKPVNYANANKKGPTVIVLPGKIKNSNASFTQKVTPNNIADFAEIELSNANFRVLERTDLGPMLKEVELAVSMGNPSALQKFKRGKFKSTKWFIKFDILKAEKVATAGQGFDGAAIGSIFGSVVGGLTGTVGSTTIRSAKASEDAAVWIIGLRYKIVDASTSEQVATGYVEKKMETGKKTQGLLGISGNAEQLTTLDTIVQRLVQEAVVKIDQRK
ncbi:CsgG/HfaB family protein [Desulfomarina sp.]